MTLKGGLDVPVVTTGGVAVAAVPLKKESIRAAPRD